MSPDNTPPSMPTAHVPAAVSGTTRDDDPAGRLKRWERAAEWPLTAAALVFLVAYSAIVIAGLDGQARRAAEIVINIVWLVFAVDYCVRLALAERRAHWFTRHLFDLAVVALPLFRPLRLLRLYAALNVFQRTAGMALRGRIVVYTVGSAILVTYIGALATFDAERSSPDSTISTFPEALWWAFVTITTVGYGDHTPVTPVGRVVATVLMIGGISIIGIVSATFASWIVGRVTEVSSEDEAATRHQVASVQREVAGLEHQVARLERQIAGLREELGSASRSRAEPESDGESGRSGPESEAEPETVSKAESGSETKVDSKAESGSKIQSEFRAQSEAEAQSDSGRPSGDSPS